MQPVENRRYGLSYPRAVSWAGLFMPRGRICDSFFLILPFPGMVLGEQQADQVMRRVVFARWYIVSVFFGVAVAAGVHGASLKIMRPESNGWVRLNTPIISNAVLTLEASSNLLAWQRIATVHDGLFDYPDAASTDFRQRFYRFFST